MLLRSQPFDNKRHPIFFFLKYKDPKWQIELQLEPDRKLLVLDLNGVLIQRFPPSDPRRKKGLTYEKRRYCDEFLTYCFKKFDVGFWTCGTLATMETDLYQRYFPLKYFTVLEASCLYTCLLPLIHS